LPYYWLTEQIGSGIFCRETKQNVDLQGTDAFKGERLKRLNQISIQQMHTLAAASNLQRLDAPKGGTE